MMTTPENGYQDTEIGQFPTEWDIGPLGAKYHIQQGKALSRNSNRAGTTRMPFLRTSNVYWGRLDLGNLDEMEFSEGDKERLRLQYGDLLICEGGDIGRTAVWKGELEGCYYQNHLFRVRSRQPDVEPVFHMYWMQAAMTQLGLYKDAGNRTTIPNLSQSRLSSFPIPVPPLPEQRRIAAVLNTIQDAIAAQEDVIAAAKEFKRSLMHRLFTVGPGREPAPTKETAIGEMPAHWEQKRVEEICTLLQYGTSQRCEIRAAGLPVLRIPNIENGAISVAELKYSEFAAKDIDNFLLRPGDLLFVRTNGRREYAGRCAVYEGIPQQALYASYLIRAQFPEEVALPNFVQAYASMPAGARQLSGRAIETADGKFNINTETIRTVVMPVPPMDEQRQIVDRIQIADAKIAAEEDRISALQALFKSMLHQLMTGQIRLLSDEGLPLA